MTLLPLLIGILLSAQDVDRNDGFGPNDSWWECSHAFRLGEGPDALFGRLHRAARLDGSVRDGTYLIWRSGLRATFHVIDTPQGSRLGLSYLSVEIPPAASRDGGQIHGYLFGDGELVATSLLLDARNARRGYGISNASFQGNEVARLARSDRWSLVVLHGDGTEILRRDLPLPERRVRDEAFAAHLAAIEAAWQRRDESLLVSVSAVSLPEGQAHCLFSTPGEREAMMMSQIGVTE